MAHTFLNLPQSLEQALTKLLGDTNSRDVAAAAKSLHERYMRPESRDKTPMVRNGKDALAYLSLRFPATFAQITSALSQIQERLPGWEPKTILDLGSGPGTGLFAAREVWLSITEATAIDREETFLTLGETLAYDTKLPIDITWKKQTIAEWIEEDSGSYDLIIVANVINELPALLVHDLLSKLADMKNGIVLLLEPGTSHGFKMIQSAAEKITKYRPLIAPYINGTLVQSQGYWVHFPQRFKRPAFQRAVRQQMRDSALMASDWEETKFSYVAFGDVPVTEKPYAVCIGEVEIYHGYLMVPLLTETSTEKVKVMKRHKDQYRFAKNLVWGDTVKSSDQVRFPVTAK